VEPRPSDSPSLRSGTEETRVAAEDDPRDAVYRLNLEAFGGRAARLCVLLQRGRLTADACFLALTQLWIQLAQSHRRLGDPAPGSRHATPQSDPTIPIKKIDQSGESAG
jgi:hypothetical protein